MERKRNRLRHHNVRTRSCQRRLCNSIHNGLWNARESAAAEKLRNLAARLSETLLILTG
jgi:hypothetical protein